MTVRYPHGSLTLMTLNKLPVRALASDLFAQGLVVRCVNLCTQGPQLNSYINLDYGIKFFY